MDVAFEAVNEAAFVASDINDRIRQIAESFARKGDEGHEYTFFCECGCLEPITLTLADFAAKGALHDGHRLASH